MASYSVSFWTTNTVYIWTLWNGSNNQIRIHMSHLGHPICGDSIYGQPSRLIARQALHAGWTSFLQPRTLAPMQFEVPLTTDMQNLLAQIDEGEIYK